MRLFILSSFSLKNLYIEQIFYIHDSVVLFIICTSRETRKKIKLMKWRDEKYPQIEKTQRSREADDRKRFLVLGFLSIYFRFFQNTKGSR